MRFTLLAALLITSLPAHAQPDFWVDTEVGLEMWPNSHRTYQHQYKINAEGGVQLKRWKATGYFRARIWQAADAKLPGSPLNAEANMNIASSRGATVAYNLWRSLYLGPTIHRRQMSVVWRRKAQNGYRNGWGSFEGNPNWEGREEICRSGDGCGSIAYNEQAGVSLSWRSERVYLSARYLPIRYKQLTLAPTPLRVRAQYLRLDKWEVGLLAYKDLRDRWRGHIKLKRHIFKSVWAQVRAARAQPDHKRAFEFVGIGLLIK